ncbi:hypothetical protein [Paraburkholderia diazotrophica]|uniref:Uncharacterized protein n=1 Tax=Paraburkholderia diazotrophica TaxID=667676 RepID=A0A1H7D1G3_9BURK|nr:hypothetical protein [Paraburkholderia diazotrophica]SEJ91955.1 hypothetical protein SAMN05192539_1023102 [Paraburkholderia diazotrophica]
MKTTIFVSAVLLGILSLAGVAQAQDASGQKDEQSASANASNNSGYGGVSGSTSASGSMDRWGAATCGHLPQCNPDSGH